jgi:enterochelin esterase-like enzyme
MPPTASPQPSATTTEPACDQPGHIEQGFFPSDIAGELSFRIYLPPCYEENGNIYPTLYMLAGNTYTDAIWDQLGLDEAAEVGIHSGELPPMLIVMPYSGERALYTSGGPNSYETVILEDLTSYIQANYCASAEPAYRALGGLSRGGYWSLEIAFRHPDAFVSVGAHSAALIDEYAKPDVNPQYTALTNHLGDLRIYLDIGAEDWVRENTLQLHADMETANIPHTWVLNEGLHEEAYWEQHVAEYLVWYSEPWSQNRADYPLCSLK